MKKYKKIVYISHPSSGLEINNKKIEEIIKILIKEYPDILFISPVHCFGFLYHEISWQDGIDQCIALLNLCDEMWVFGDWEYSRGCTYEVQYCKFNHKPFKIIPDNLCYKTDTIKYLDKFCLYSCEFCELTDDSIYCNLTDLHTKTQHIENIKT